MTERAAHSHEDVDPSDPTGPVASAAVDANAGLDDGIITVAEDLRIVRSDVQWVLEQRGGKTWKSIAFCASKEGLILRLKEHLLKEHLTRLDFYQPKKVQVTDKKTGKLVWKNIVTREALDATDAARAALKCDDMTRFNINPEGWAAIQVLPDYFPKPKG